MNKLAAIFFNLFISRPPPAAATALFLEAPIDNAALLLDAPIDDEALFLEASV